ncbi:6076_t:CDS:1 [Ambispora gerdemannii]|uniref:6076_t:CDS:1 n=1 Tax=Ambispora gerdemannii TaxID=144530 RepID=A0A9N8Z9X9_9GLOM|nr:6076_t:CDS:1 [Ambispora gerdemannii]
MTITQDKSTSPKRTKQSSIPSSEPPSSKPSTAPTPSNVPKSSPPTTKKKQFPNDLSNCEKFFDVNRCDNCQKTTFDAVTTRDSSTAGCFDLYFLDFQENNQSLQDVIGESCNKNCDFGTVDMYRTSIQNACVANLRNDMNLLLNPSSVYENYTSNSIISTVFRIFYFAEPTAQSFCMHNAKAPFSYCPVDAVSSYNTHAKGSEVNAMLNLSPPNLKAYTTSGNVTRLSNKNIICNDCYKNMTAVWHNYFNNTPPIINGLNTSIANEVTSMRANLIKNCNYNDKVGSADSSYRVGHFKSFVLVCLVFLGFTSFY